MTREDVKKRVEDFKIKAKWKVEDGRKWMSDHSSEILAGAIVFGPMVLGVAKEAIKMHDRKEAREEERFRRDQQIYDPSTGLYLDTKRPMKSWERLEISERHERGESYSSILRDMGLVSRR